MRAGCRVPELDGGIISSAGECASIWGKGEALDVVGEPARPEQGPALCVPQLDAPIPARSGKGASIRAEGEGTHCVAMCLPGQVQEPPFLAPHAYFSPPAARSPVPSIEADGYRPGDIKGLVQDCLTQAGPGKGGILHLDPLQRCPPDAELRQIQAAQVPALLAQKRQHVRRSVALRILCFCTQLVEQREQVLLHFNSPTVHIP